MLHSPLGTFPETWKKLWIAFKTQNEIALQYMSGIFNGSMVVERYNHSIVAREDGIQESKIHSEVKPLDEARAVARPASHDRPVLSFFTS